jgi:GABA(A) receptor-associated protein
MENTLLDLQGESNRLRSKFRDRIPVIVNGVPALDKVKYLVPCELTFGGFMNIIRRRIKLNPNQALVGFVQGLLPPTSKLMSDIYHESCGEDGFLYVTYSLENTFGAFHRLQTANP